MINKEGILKALAEKHRILVCEDDPILTIFMTNELILENYAENMVSVVKRLGDELIGSVRTMQEQEREWSRQEYDNIAKFHRQIIIDAQIQFERSLDQTINMIRGWYLEMAEMKTSAWTAAGAALAVMVVLAGTLVAIFLSH